MFNYHFWSHQLWRHKTPGPSAPASPDCKTDNTTHRTYKAYAIHLIQHQIAWCTLVEFETSSVMIIIEFVWYMFVITVYRWWVEHTFVIIVTIRSRERKVTDHSSLLLHVDILNPWNIRTQITFFRRSFFTVSRALYLFICASPMQRYQRRPAIAALTFTRRCVQQSATTLYEQF